VAFSISIREAPTSAGVSRSFSLAFSDSRSSMPGMADFPSRSSFSVKKYSLVPGSSTFRSMA
jgi:hypothetical protein